jgi:S-DNA-T family DNA segregation ATPase FtsK/SpoIIIE
MSLLRETHTVGMNQDEIQRKSRIIEETLAQFGVPGRVTEVRPGPTVTQFGVSPGYISRSGDSQRKVRVSQIASLSDDLALALAARSLRVEAPVPGRAIVGIEVPNAEIYLVGLRVVLESEAFQKCGKPLCVAIGLDVAGTPQVTDLAKMPHLLIAGTTGSGKSVFVKALAASLVMHNSPDSLRLLTIDPKMVELTHLNGLPHLLGSTETDLDSILNALRWVAHEMDRRYKLFASYAARNLDDYNAKISRKRKGTSDDDEKLESLPRIVVFIDELADLMMSAPDETERTLTRIAQMARATGIVMVVATQRPSTDVVTGLIKANFPARVSFATTSIVDSRVIIDMPGAESLLGRGDMLFLPPEASTPVRVQGCFISDEELEAIKGFWQKEAGATPAKAPWEVITESAGPESLRLDGQSADADLLEKAIAYAKQRGQLSTSGLQRRLHISYPRAARIVEEMERMGIIGPQESAGRPRRVILGGEGS